ncbi:hypothetical protein FI206_02510 [Salmonella enterica subsp. enterica]|nr:hypothetical protein [Salmonella enterica subsp. enterica serovar Hessarek]
MTTFTNKQIVALIDIDVFKIPARDTASRNKRIEEGKKLKAEYDKGSFTKTAAVKAILEAGGKVDAVQMNNLLGITTKKRVSGATDVPQNNEQLNAMQQEIEQLRASLKAAEALNALVPVIASKENQSSVLDKITAEEQAKELADIQRYTEERKKQTEETITKQMRLVFPDYSPDIITSIVEETSYTYNHDVKGLTQSEIDHCINEQFDQDKIDEYRLDIWQSKIENLDTKLRTEAKKVIGVDGNNWEMIKKVYEEITKAKS